MLYIGLDDTDSVRGGCTTWLATEIIIELSEFDLVCHPRLVRLNPNVPWKTRGNGAVSLAFGKGVGSKQKVGSFGDTEIYAFERGEDFQYDPKEVLKMATVNGSKILNKKIGCIKEGYIADCIFIDKKSIDLEPLHNVHASIVHRASEKSIAAVAFCGASSISRSFGFLPQPF